MRIEATAETKNQVAQQRIRAHTRDAQALVLVAEDGWHHDKHDNRDLPAHASSRGMNVRLSMNGPLKMTYAEWRELVDAIEESWQAVTGTAAPPTRVDPHAVADLDAGFGLGTL